MSNMLNKNIKAEGPEQLTVSPRNDAIKISKWIKSVNMDLKDLIDFIKGQSSREFWDELLKRDFITSLKQRIDSDIENYLKDYNLSEEAEKAMDSEEVFNSYIDTLKKNHVFREALAYHEFINNREKIMIDTLVNSSSPGEAAKKIQNAINKFIENNKEKTLLLARSIIDYISSNTDKKLAKIKTEEFKGFLKEAKQKADEKLAVLYAAEGIVIVNSTELAEEKALSPLDQFKKQINTALFLSDKTVDILESMSSEAKHIIRKVAAPIKDHEESCRESYAINVGRLLDYAARFDRYGEKGKWLENNFEDIAEVLRLENEKYVYIVNRKYLGPVDISVFGYSLHDGNIYKNKDKEIFGKDDPRIHLRAVILAHDKYVEEEIKEKNKENKELEEYLEQDNDDLKIFEPKGAKFLSDNDKAYLKSLPNMKLTPEAMVRKILKDIIRNLALAEETIKIIEGLINYNLSSPHYIVRNQQIYMYLSQAYSAAVEAKFKHLLENNKLLIRGIAALLAKQKQLFSNKTNSITEQDYIDILAGHKKLIDISYILVKAFNIYLKKDEVLKEKKEELKYKIKEIVEKVSLVQIKSMEMIIKDHSPDNVDNLNDLDRIQKYARGKLGSLYTRAVGLEE